MVDIPKVIYNSIGGRHVPSVKGLQFANLDPTNGETICTVSASTAEDVSMAVESARNAQPLWGGLPAVQRGAVLHDIAMALRARREEIARIVARETGKSYSSALGETDGAISLGLFYAGEGQRLYGRTTTSGTPNKYAMTYRQPVGVAGLIIAANTPIANVAWKVFPALICGNAAVLKAAEDTPATAWIFASIANDAGLPEGVLNVVQGLGEAAGAPLVEHPDVGVISFTGSTGVGREIAVTAGKRLAKISLELGGKNPLVVCDDADLQNAANWVILSAFSNAGQRCASGSRIIIFESVYEQFKQMLVEKTKSLKVGSSDDDDLGPVINERQLDCMVSAVESARKNGAVVLVGGERMRDISHEKGFYMEPTLMENVDINDDISRNELFGPIAVLYKVKNYDEALALSNDSPYGLTACIHTRSIHRAVHYSDKVQSGVVVVNAGTYGSEPHMPFGGLKQSGNGTREPGTEALDVYSELKDVYINIDPGSLD